MKSKVEVKVTKHFFISFKKCLVTFSFLLKSYQTLFKRNEKVGEEIPFAKRRPH